MAMNAKPRMTVKSHFELWWLLMESDGPNWLEAPWRMGFFRDRATGDS